jgi:DNA repair exonuclease SbcCD ATPase subunit
MSDDGPYVAIESTAAAIAVTDDAPTKISLAETSVSLDDTHLAKIEAELEIMRQAYQEQIAALHASQTQSASHRRAGHEFQQAAEEAHNERMQFERELILARGRIEELEQRTAQLTTECQKARAACSPASSISTSALRVIEDQRNAAAEALEQEREKCLQALEELKTVRTEGTRLARELTIVQDGYRSQVRQLEASHDVSGHSERALRELRIQSQQEAADLSRALENERCKAATLERSLVEREDEVERLAEELEQSETVCRRQAEELTTGSSHATEIREQLSRMSARAQAAMTRVSGLQVELSSSRSEAERLASRLRVEEVKRTVLTRRLGEAAARLRELHGLDRRGDLSADRRARRTA